MLKIAVVTQVKNENLFLPLWQRYYGGLFGYGNLFVIDDGSTDGSTANLGPTRVLDRPQRPFDERERADEAAAFLEELLKFYDWVIYCDVDEFLVLDPLLNMDFQAYLRQAPGKHLNAVGINILHNVHAEAEYAAEIPVFRQRRFGAFDRSYCKQLVHSESVRFRPGFHMSNRMRNFVPGLFLMHLAHLDRENTRRRWQTRNKIAWSEHAIKSRHSLHFRMPVEAFIAERFDIPPAKFADASGPELFLARVRDFLPRVIRERTNDDIAATIRYQQMSPLLRFPERFRDTIPAATAPFGADEAANQVPVVFDSGFDPHALYRSALDRVHSEN